jgi:hypothetical protein
MADLSVTFDELQREIAVKLGWSRDSTAWSTDESDTVDAIVNEGLRDAYYAIDPRTQRLHKWSFLYPQATLNLSAPYSTGTVGAASGVVTLAAGTFPSWAGSGELIVDGVAYDVATRDGDTQVTLTDTSVTITAGTTYILGHTKYDLPTDFGALDGPITYSPAAQEYVQPIQLVDEGTIRRWRQWHTQWTWSPTMAAVIPKELTATSAQAWRLYLAPTPDTTYVLWYRYQRNPEQLDSTNKYPWGGPLMGQSILYACLAAAERKLHDEEEVYAAKYRETIVAAIDQDKTLGAPAFIGSMNRDAYRFHQRVAASSHYEGHF